MQLRTATESDLFTLMDWFNSLEDVQQWGGPRMCYPFSLAQLKKDIRWDVAQSFALAANDQLLGFAQVFDRYGCLHIAQVAVNPARRGEGLGAVLVESIFAQTKTLSKDYSLFVLTSNKVAKKLYEKLGFTIEQSPPGEQHLAECIFMVRSKH